MNLEAESTCATKGGSVPEIAHEKKEGAGAKAALRSAVEDKRKCPVCLLLVCKAAWAQCFGEDDCPGPWDLFKKEGVAV